MTDYLRSDLDNLFDQGVISRLDYYFAKTMADIYEGSAPLILLSAALVSKALAEGHICLNLARAAGTVLIPEREGQGTLCLPSLKHWLGELEQSGMVARESDHPGDFEAARLDWIRRSPLILDPDNNLYLAKYYDFQHRLVYNISARVADAPEAIDRDFLSKGIDRFFGDQDKNRTAGQREAVEKALDNNFLVISGGPGTGKTHITNIIRTLLQEWAKQEGKPEPRILSMAPTGKAASRLTDGATIHSVLKPKPAGTGFRHNADYPVAADVVIIDEASMIDIALMTRLMEAVPTETKVVLLGDKNQLSPVQAGAVFTDICEVDAMAGHRVFLEFNFRSEGKTGIENLARAVNQNDVTALTGMLTDRTYDDVIFEDTGNKSDILPILTKHVSKGYKALALARTPEEALASLDDFRVLCAHNRGDAGTLQVSHLCENILRTYRDNDIKGSLFRQIVMVSQNDYEKGLFNGDTGVVWEENRMTRVSFEGTGGENRQFRFSDLPAHESAFAVTIHKSQGSEYGTVLILIPERISPVVTRQLLYTGITRARKKAVIMGSLKVIREAMDMPLERRSNVAALLARVIKRQGD
ncbi:MAG: exodeoxyribonuclease V subunit alpha [Desulfobacterales bacterium]|nr:exodeoxyribonuclease V subunit alpha [Desulfobacterales bacterium]